MRLGRRLVAANDLGRRKAVSQADNLQGQQGQRLGVAGQYAKLAAARAQRTNQLDSPRRGLRSPCQQLFVVMQPGMLGCRLDRRQSGQVLQNILLLGDPQRSILYVQKIDNYTDSESMYWQAHLWQLQLPFQHLK